jgi:hypothetical protein
MSKIRRNVKNSDKCRKFGQMSKIRTNVENSDKCRKFGQMSKIILEAINLFDHVWSVSPKLLES